MDPGPVPDAPAEAASLYVHIPFCARLCPYCHFHVQVSREPRVQLPTVDAIAREWQIYADAGWWDRPLPSAYLGGGTPSALRGTARERAIAWLGDQVRPRLTPDAEVTLEVNPEDASVENLAAWVEAGVNRISLGVQADDAATLKFLGRAHDPAATQAALSVVASLVDNVSLDLIVGTPGVDQAATVRWLESVVDARVKHASLYLLEIHPDTAFARQVDAGRWTPPPGEDQAATYLAAGRWLGEHAFAAYELSNHARAGFRSVHNGRYWDRRPYVGLGPSAHSFAGDRRWWNSRDGAAYVAATASGSLPTESGERLTGEQVRDETIYLGLRRVEGIPLTWIPDRSAIVAALVDSGLGSIAQERLSLTPEGWLMHDEIAAQLLR